jgi:PLP dependent protein
MAGAEKLDHVRIAGLMGMATLTEDKERLAAEFRALRSLRDKYFPPAPGAQTQSILSMGMSGDYPIAIREGSTMVRIGSLLFGKRG